MFLDNKKRLTYICNALSSKKFINLLPNLTHFDFLISKYTDLVPNLKHFENKKKQKCKVLLQSTFSLHTST